MVSERCTNRLEFDFLGNFEFINLSSTIELGLSTKKELLLNKKIKKPLHTTRLYTACSQPDIFFIISLLELE